MRAYNIYRNSEGRYGVSQMTINGYPWDHSYHHGCHDTPEAAEDWARNHAGGEECLIARDF